MLCGGGGNPSLLLQQKRQQLMRRRYRSDGLFLWLLIMLTAGCQAPFLTFSGNELSGLESEATSFDFAGNFKTLQLEVRPEDPYSVILRVVMRDKKLYIDAAENRRWHTYLKADPRIRIKLGKKIYRARAIKLTSAEIPEGFIRGRTIYEIVPGH